MALNNGTLRRLSCDASERALNFLVDFKKNRYRVVGGRYKIFLPYLSSITENPSVRFMEINRDIVCGEAILKSHLRDTDTDFEIRKKIVWHINDINLYKDICGIKKSSANKSELEHLQYLDCIMTDLNNTLFYLKQELQKIEEKILRRKFVEEPPLHTKLKVLKQRFLN